MRSGYCERGACVRLVVFACPRPEATGFGVMQVDALDRVVEFLEKPADPPGMPGKPDIALASMGIYIFNARFLYEQLRRDAADPASSHDFGKDLVPHLVTRAGVLAHSLTRRSEEGRVGKEGVSTGRSRWSPYHSKKQNRTITT